MSIIVVMVVDPWGDPGDQGDRQYQLVVDLLETASLVAAVGKDPWKAQGSTVEAGTLASEAADLMEDESRFWVPGRRMTFLGS